MEMETRDICSLNFFAAIITWNTVKQWFLDGLDQIVTPIQWENDCSGVNRNS